MQRDKKTRLDPAQIRAIAYGYGACIASNHILEGKPVGFMYRDQPEYGNSSGWFFFSGEESQDYVDDPNNLSLYDVNTIANYDPSIVVFLDAPVGSAYARDENGELQPQTLPCRPREH